MKAHLLSALVPLRVPRVFHHHDFVSSRPVMSRLLGGALRRADLSIAVSRAVAEDLRRTFGPIAQEVVYNAIDLGRFFPAPEDGGALDDAAGLPRGGPRLLRIGLVATYARWKGHALFLEAAARTLAETPDVPLRFFLVGGPSLPDDRLSAHPRRARGRGGRLGLAGRVGFVPFTRDTAPVYRSLDVVVHASTRARAVRPHRGRGDGLWPAGGRERRGRRARAVHRRGRRARLPSRECGCARGPARTRRDLASSGRPRRRDQLGAPVRRTRPPRGG